MISRPDRGSNNIKQNVHLGLIFRLSLVHLTPVVKKFPT